MFDILFNGHNGREIGVAISTRPSIQAPEKRGEWVEIAGRSGSVLVSDGSYENITIEIAMNIVQPRDRINSQFRRVKDWLSGTGELRFTDDREVYYKVRQVGVTEFSRRIWQGADIIATFICDPFAYLESGRNEITMTAAKTNPGTVSCLPIYHITGGNGTAGTLTVNGNVFNFTGRTAGVFLDVENGRAYSGSTNLNNTVQGDYNDLILKPGANTITVTPSGTFTCKVIPNWRLL